MILKNPDIVERKKKSVMHCSIAHTHNKIKILGRQNGWEQLALSLAAEYTDHDSQEFYGYF